jgi:serine/threonine protein phosphatase PrpC
MQNSSIDDVSFACLSDIGKVRHNNEDMAYAGESPYGTLLVIADGMGGHRNGEVASKIIADTLSLGFTSARHPFKTHSAKRFLLSKLKEANKRIYKTSIEEFGGTEIGSTAVTCLITRDGTYLVSVGDSRCYTYSARDGLIHKTTDQTYVECLFESGKITQDEIANHPQKNILINAVGIYPDLSKIEEARLEKDSFDVILLCSDGLYNMISDEDISKILSNKALKASQKARALVDQALANGGKDNVAVALWERPQ